MNAPKALAGLLATAIFVAGAAPALAQADDLAPETNERVNMVIIYGDDACPESTDPDEIIICPVLEESERFRIPENLRESSDPANESWTSRATSVQTVGSFGTMSCSPSGAGGWTGCTQQLIEAAYAEKRGASSVRAAQLIEEERARRLATIDEEAAEEQARVEEIEKQYEARLKAERDAQLPGELDGTSAQQDATESD